MLSEADEKQIEDAPEITLDEQEENGGQKWREMMKIEVLHFCKVEFIS